VAKGGGLRGSDEEVNKSSRSNPAEDFYRRPEYSLKVSLVLKSQDAERLLHCTSRVRSACWCCPGPRGLEASASAAACCSATRGVCAASTGVSSARTTTDVGRDPWLVLGVEPDASKGRLIELNCCTDMQQNRWFVFLHTYT
jgi:hypothetical protein